MAKTFWWRLALTNPGGHNEYCMLELSGLDNPCTVRQLRIWNSSLSPDIVFLLEIKLTKDIAKNLKNRIGFSNAFSVSSRGRSEGCLSFGRMRKFLFI